MMPNTVTVKNSNGRTYISTRWALGITVGLLVLILGGWGRWMQATVINDHDALIRNSAKLVEIDKHVLANAVLIQKVLDEHTSIMLGGAR